MIKDRNRSRRTTLALLSSAVAAGTLVALAPAAGAATPAPVAAGPSTPARRPARSSISRGSSSRHRRSPQDRRDVKIANTVADGYFANCVEAP
ncbi:MAG: hypothetical protein R2755_18740 [Acidimicrobiales bacterium]